MVKKRSFLAVIQSNGQFLHQRFKFGLIEIELAVSELLQLMEHVGLLHDWNEFQDFGLNVFLVEVQELFKFSEANLEVITLINAIKDFIDLEVIVLEVQFLDHEHEVFSLQIRLTTHVVSLE